MVRPRATSGICVVCGHETTDRVETPARGGSRAYSTWRCADLEACAARRNAKRKRPR